MPCEFSEETLNLEKITDNEATINDSAVPNNQAVNENAAPKV